MIIILQYKVNYIILKTISPQDFTYFLPRNKVNFVNVKAKN